MARLSASVLRQTNREYTKSNRENWANLGFRNITCLVHDDERDVVLAELEVRRCDAMVALAENPKTPANQLLILSQRNMSALPLKGELTKLAEEAETSRAKGVVLKMIDIARNYVKRYRGIEAKYHNVEDDERRVNMAARAVAYSAACAAQLRLIKVTLEAAPLRDTSIFGLREVEE